MHFLHLLPAVFALAAAETKFLRFVDMECQRSDLTYVKVSAEEQKQIVKANYATTGLTPEASRGLYTAIAADRCPSNADDTYAWVTIPQWSGPRGGGAIAAIYYNDTDTYLACRYLAGVVGNYAGFCQPYTA